MSKIVNLSSEYLLQVSILDETFNEEDLMLRRVNGFCWIEKCPGELTVINLMYEDIILHFVEISKDCYKLVHFKDLNNDS